jgi:hypothetical protein
MAAPELLEITGVCEADACPDRTVLIAKFKKEGP